MSLKKWHKLSDTRIAKVVLVSLLKFDACWDDSPAGTRVPGTSRMETAVFSLTVLLSERFASVTQYAETKTLVPMRLSGGSHLGDG
jgi:hypothetical protein